jgi:hypothetical protein
MSGYDNISETMRTVATSTTATANDYGILVIGATGAVTITLPAISAITPGRPYWIYKDAAAQTITIQSATGGVTIDGAANTTLASGAAHAKRLINDGTNWFTEAAY